MTVRDYINKNYSQFKDQILHFLDKKSNIIFGGFVRSILLDEIWNNELDVMCFNLKKTVEDFKQIYPPEEILDEGLHIYFKYKNGLTIDFSNYGFLVDDFSFNIFGLIEDNLIILDNFFSLDIEDGLKLIDEKKYVFLKKSRIYRKEKYKNLLENWENVSPTSRLICLT